VSFLKELSQKNKKFAPIVSSLVCVAIGLERAKSFAQTQQGSSPATVTPSPTPQAPTPTSTPTPAAATKADKQIDLPLPASKMDKAEAPPQDTKAKRSEVQQMLPLELRALQKFQSVKTKKEACAMLEGRVVTYYDVASFIVDCLQRPVEDPDLLNDLVYSQKKEVAEIPAHIYRLIPFGEPWTGKNGKSLTTSKVCRELNGRYVTSTGTDYYYIDGCKKRSFSSYVELQAHNLKNAPVVTVSPEQLDKLDSGSSVDGNYQREVDALYKIVGDSTLNPLGSADGSRKPVGSAEELNALPKSAQKANSKILCQQYENKVISYYSQLFFITGCQKRALRELPITIQQKFSEQGTHIIDLTASQVDSIPTGKELSEDEALALIK
jgi:hypothetical protein